jgi:DNA polymerase-3 subunit delta'
VRELQHSLSLAPYQSPYRVALLLRFEKATDGTSNALLKTLEEPPEKVILALTAESAEVLLPTIVSRCLVLRLRRSSLGEVEQGLQKRGLPADRARFLAHLSDGRPGSALALEQHPELLEQRLAWLAELQANLASNYAARFAFVDKLTKNKDNQSLDRDLIRKRLQAWSSLWRDVFLLSSDAREEITNVDRAETIQSIAGQIDFPRVCKTLASLERTARHMDGVINARLALEVLMLDLPQVDLRQVHLPRVNLPD